MGLRIISALALLAFGAACERSAGGGADSFDGANYATQTDKVEHGKRISEMLTCAGCHGGDYAGQDFGAMIPVVEGLWATNLALAMPKLSDAQLEEVLRQGTHPSGRELYIMPSKQSQFLSARDMAALIAYLRSIPEAGAPTPAPPADFEQSVVARLPEDYWLWRDGNQARTYHNAAEEVAYFAEHRVPDLGAGRDLVQGRYIASVLCSSCHGAELDGVGEPAGDMQGALDYDLDAFHRLLAESVDREGNKVVVEWGFGHEALPLTESERASAISYVTALAKSRTQ